MKLGILFLIIAGLGLLHQQLTGGGWFNWSQFWHHEPLIAIAFSLGVWALIWKR